MEGSIPKASQASPLVQHEVHDMLRQACLGVGRYTGQVDAHGPAPFHGLPHSEHRLCGCLS